MPSCCNLPREISRISTSIMTSGFGEVDGVHELLRHAHILGRVAHDDGVGALVDDQRLRIEHGLEQALNVSWERRC